MFRVPRSILVCLTLISLVMLGTGCGGSEPSETGSGGVAEAAAPSTQEKTGEVAEQPAGGGGRDGAGAEQMNVRDAESVIEAFKEAAALEGIYFGEVPEGFPLDIIPVHPDGEIDKSSVDPDSFTLLQVIEGSKDSVFDWYKDHFEGLGFAAGDPFEFGGRTMVSFAGSDGEVSMTMSEQEPGRIFTSMALSPK